MRLYFIDNLRNICILLLIPYHTFLIYNAYDYHYLLQGPENIPLSLLLLSITPWIMALMFMLAGVSSRYSLVKRTPAVYIKERILRLFIPFIAGMLLLVPFQTYTMKVWYSGYSEGFLTYLSQYPAEQLHSFYLGQLWFVIYLFIISLIALPIMYFWTKSKRTSLVEKIPVWGLCLLFIVPWLLLPVGSLGGDMSLGRYFFYFILGYLVLSNEQVQNRLVRWRLPLLIISLILLTLYLITLFCVKQGAVFEPLLTLASYSFLMNEALAVLCSLTLIGYGKQYLESHTAATDYLSESSFTVYVFHQSWLAVIALFLFSITDNMAAQIPGIIISTFIATYISYEVVKRFRLTRFLFGIKEPKPEKG